MANKVIPYSFMLTRPLLCHYQYTFFDTSHIQHRWSSSSLTAWLSSPLQSKYLDVLLIDQRFNIRKKAMLEHDVIIAVCDAQRAHIYQNVGTPQSPKLDFVTGFEQKLPPSSQLGTEKPGTSFGSIDGPRSQVSHTDLHYARQKAFAQDILEALSALSIERNFSRLIWIAPPKMLALLRAGMPTRLKAITLAEIDKDLTKHPTAKIIELMQSYHL